VELRKIFHVVFYFIVKKKLIFIVRYDFRRGVDEQDDFFSNFTQLVTDTYELNNQTKVVIVTHSMGGSLFLFEC
jgi:hypothetical protein